MNPNIPLLRSPKTLLLTDGIQAERIRKLCADPLFEVILKEAFTEFCWNLPAATNPNESWAANAMRHGARQFIATVLTLGIPPQERGPITAGKLEPEKL